VTDQGCGLAPDAADRLFSLFYTTKPKGLGLGLSIARTIVESHGGHLTAIPQSPHGVTFRFTIPAMDGRVPPDSSDPSAAQMLPRADDMASNPTFV
jgi:signal transduction histidine kinase